MYRPDLTDIHSLVVSWFNGVEPITKELVKMKFLAQKLHCKI